MRRLGRILTTTATTTVTGLSVILCLASAVLWIRSYWYADWVEFQVRTQTIYEFKPRAIPYSLYVSQALIVGDLPRGLCVYWGPKWGDQNTRTGFDYSPGQTHDAAKKWVQHIFFYDHARQQAILDFPGFRCLPNDVTNPSHGFRFILAYWLVILVTAPLTLWRFRPSMWQMPFKWPTPAKPE